LHPTTLGFACLSMDGPRVLLAASTLATKGLGRFRNSGAPQPI
jgi:hypothetical protein